MGDTEYDKFTKEQIDNMFVNFESLTDKELHEKVNEYATSVVDYWRAGDDEGVKQATQLFNEANREYHSRVQTEIPDFTDEQGQI